MRRFFLFFILIGFALPDLLAQKTEEQPAPTTQEATGAPKKPRFPVPKGDIPVIYEDTLESDKRVERKKKIPKKTFWGIKTRKAFTKTVSGKKVTYELFYILKKDQPTDPYVRDIYWYQRKKRKINYGPIPLKDQPYAKILHGPYEKRVGKVVVEQGQFYIGAKHGRWEAVTNTEDEILMDKKKWYKGFPKDSKFTHYDVDKTKLAEVVPIDGGVKHGEYFKYFESGQIHIAGKYEHDQKVGIWREYFLDPKKPKVKTEMQHAPDGFAKDFEPYLIREYNEKGQIKFDKATEDKKKKDGKK